MPARVAALLVLIAAAGGASGCLRAFGPDLRARGDHASLGVGGGDTQCMSCHESEADALARMQAAPDHDHADPAAPHHHGDGAEHVHVPAPVPPAGMATDGPPLVADWMVADARGCTTCHRLRP